ncbi:MAG: hypothetical protein I8H67_09490 [Comamonadaceae bacterium]|jgi:hypothetical protein|nr:hypothetical protein [Comamonadaceae bacterium]MBH2044026.1 hypothetical protein [Comamonadaceae bacterium]
MATETVNRFDRESIADEAVALGDLADWVIKARDIIEDVNRYASALPTFGEEIKRCGIGISNADWGCGKVPDGLAYVLMRQRELITSLA